MSEPVVHFQARVPKELAEWFDAHFPADGSKQWFILASLRALKDSVDAGIVEPPVNIPTIVVNTGFSHL